MDYRKIKDLRVDLDEIFAYTLQKSNKREKGWHDKIYLYPKSFRGTYLEVYFDTMKDNDLFKETVFMLDEFFSVKTEAESRILP